LNFLWYCTPNLLQLTDQFSVLVTTAFSFSLSFSRRGQSNIMCCTVCGPFLQGHVGSSIILYLCRPGHLKTGRWGEYLHANMEVAG